MFVIEWWPTPSYQGQGRKWYRLSKTYTDPEEATLALYRLNRPQDRLEGERYRVREIVRPLSRMEITT